MNARTITLGLATLALVAVPMLATAQGPGFGRGGGDCANMTGRHGDGPGGARMLLGPVGDTIGLSDEQRAEIKSIFDASREAAEPLRTQLAQEREAFRATHQPGSFDEAAMRAHAEAQSALHAELQVLRMKAMADAHRVLTAEQQAELNTLREQRGEMGPRHGRRGGARGGRN